MTTTVEAATASACAGALVVLGGVRLRPVRRRDVTAPATTLLARRPTRLRLPPRLVVAAGLIAALVAGGPIAAVLGAVVAMLRPRWLAVSAERRTEARLVADYPDFVDLLVLAVGAGCTPLDALACTSVAVQDPIRAALLAVGQAVATGSRLADALPLLAERLGPIAQPLVDGLSLADRYGTALPPVLDRLGAEARGQRRRNAEVAARQLPVRLAFPLVCCTLPSFVLLTIVPVLAGSLSSLHGLDPA